VKETTYTFTMSWKAEGQPEETFTLEMVEPLNLTLVDGLEHLKGKIHAIQSTILDARKEMETPSNLH
jgi:hypothetical protein